jgi:SAM-dependent methyltransferase
VRPEWYHRDNEFVSARRMRKAHDPIVRLAARTLRRGGAVLDLGCGNGALLEEIRARRPATVPFGIDRLPERLAHAREVHPDFAANFVGGEIADLVGGRVRLPADRFALAIVSIRRFSDAGAGKEGLLGWLRGHADEALVYRYGREPLPDLAAIAAETGLVLKPPSADRASLLLL